MGRKKGSKDKKQRIKKEPTTIMRVPVSLKDHFKSLIQLFKKKVDY